MLLEFPPCCTALLCVSGDARTASGGVDVERLIGAAENQTASETAEPHEQKTNLCHSDLWPADPNHAERDRKDSWQMRSVQQSSLC